VLINLDSVEKFCASQKGLKVRQERRRNVLASAYTTTARAERSSPSPFAGNWYWIVYTVRRQLFRLRVVPRTAGITAQNAQIYISSFDPRRASATRDTAGTDSETRDKSCDNNANSFPPPPLINSKWQSLSTKPQLLNRITLLVAGEWKIKVIFIR